MLGIPSGDPDDVEEITAQGVKVNRNGEFRFIRRTPWSSPQAPLDRRSSRPSGERPRRSTPSENASAPDDRGAMRKPGLGLEIEGPDPSSRQRGSLAEKTPQKARDALGCGTSSVPSTTITFGANFDLSRTSPRRAPSAAGTPAWRSERQGVHRPEPGGGLSESTVKGGVDFSTRRSVRRAPAPGRRHRQLPLPAGRTPCISPSRRIL